MFSFRAFYIYSPIFAKFVSSCLHIMLLNICDFCENWCREGPIFLLGTNQIKFRAYRNDLGHSESKERLCQVCYVTKYIFSTLFSLFSVLSDNTRISQRPDPLHLPGSCYFTYPSWVTCTNQKVSSRFTCTNQKVSSRFT